MRWPGRIVVLVPTIPVIVPTVVIITLPYLLPVTAAILIIMEVLAIGMFLSSTAPSLLQREIRVPPSRREGSAESSVVTAGVDMARSWQPFTASTRPRPAKSRVVRRSNNWSHDVHRSAFSSCSQTTISACQTPAS